MEGAAPPSVPPTAPTGPSGATAQTGGFAQAGDSPSPLGAAAPAPAAATTTTITTQDTTAPVVPITSQFGFLAPAGLPGSGAIPMPLYASGTGGGLASSPNVPKPGTSIDPATGRPHQAGLTRAELEQMRAKGKGLLDPTPQAETARRSSVVKNQFGVMAGEEAINSTREGRRLSQLDGREQAARQLGGTATTTGGEKELPGGYGPVKPVPVSGQGSTSLYEDVNETLHKVGTAAFAVLPAGLKEALSNQPSEASQTSPTSPRRGSMAAFLDAAKGHTQQLVQEVRRSVDDGRRQSLKGEFVPRAQEESVLGQVKDQVKSLWNEALQGTAGIRSMSVDATATGVTVRESMPSNEPAGALPGEHSSGVGALPGTSAETGVAILPDERAASTSLPSHENQGILPGETSGGVGALPGLSTEKGVALLPDEKEAEGSLGGLQTTGQSQVPTGTQTPAAPATSGTVGGVTEATAPKSGSSSSGPYLGLAAALPATILGTGAAKGATDAPATGLSDQGELDPKTSAAQTSSITSSLTAESGLAPPQETRLGNDRTTSMASVTAIRDGHEGDRHLSGDAVGVKAATAGAAATVGGATAGALTSEGTKSKTPGAVEGGVGHPSTRGLPETERQPGSYPTADHSTQATTGSVPPIGSDVTGAALDPTSDAKPTQPIVDTPSKTVPTEASTISPTSATKNPADTTAAPIPASDSRAGNGSAVANGNGSSLSSVNGNGKVEGAGHRRSSSTASGKKVGFMNKLKGEMKVISGKIGNDQEKIQLGEKIKHGEL